TSFSLICKARRYAGLASLTRPQAKSASPSVFHSSDEQVGLALRAALAISAPAEKTPDLLTLYGRLLEADCVAEVWLGDQTSPVIGSPVESCWGLPKASTISRWGSTPRQERMVAVRSAGDAGRSVTYPAMRSVLP